MSTERRCQSEGCMTILSHYNQGTRCAACMTRSAPPAQPRKLRAAQPAPRALRAWVDATCGGSAL